MHAKQIIPRHTSWLCRDEHDDWILTSVCGDAPALENLAYHIILLIYKCYDGNMSLAQFFDMLPANNVGTSICGWALVVGNPITQTEIEEFKVRMYDPDYQVKTLKNIGLSSVTLRKCFDRALSPDDRDEVIVYECNT